MIRITALPGSATGGSEAYLDQMFRLRARVFCERLGWDVTIREGRERAISTIRTPPTPSP